MKYYVSANAAPNGSGSSSAPFGTISRAAEIAQPGDEVIVAPGIYRERVDPKNSGREDARIIYRSEVNGGAVITGAEPVKNWERYNGEVWVCRVDNGFFGDCNPFATLISGDWYIASMIAHIGDVYLNDKSMYEVGSIEAVLESKESAASWDREFSVYTWYAEAGEENTVIYANFHGLDPNRENVEISVRRSCFYPESEGIGYITLSGFRICKAATQWAPPTAYQEGMVGPHWSKGWIIEDCEIFESKCAGISLGKYYQENNDNKWLHSKFKDGTQTERECICRAQYEGWTKERIGSHTVRRCDIHHCGQAGIVGHLGAVFSLIEDNHIHHINNKQNLAGAEIGGIKLHAAIDVVFRRNHIHHCTRGIWLDWQAQGTRVTGNLFHDNCLPQLRVGEEVNVGFELFSALGEDLFVEVSHGPTLIDNNVFLSPRAMKLACQGVAAVHNLIAGSLAAVGIGTDNGAKTMSSPRYTPYHVPHRTEVAGFMTFLHGDARFYNNIFVQQKLHPALRMLEKFMSTDGNGWDDGCVSAGTARYNGYPTQSEWESEFEGYCGMGSEPSDRYYMHLPVWAAGNAYLGGAEPWEKEVKPAVDSRDVELRLEEENGEIRLHTNIYELMPECSTVFSDTMMLGMAFEPEQKFESPDGTPIVFDTDYFGNKRSQTPIPGPFAAAGEEITLILKAD